VWSKVIDSKAAAPGAGPSEPDGRNGQRSVRGV